MPLPVKLNQVMALVRARVSDGTLVPGGPAPSGPELSRITGYGIVTCRNALKALQADGVLIAGVTRNARLRVAGPLSGQALDDAAQALCGELVTRRRAAGLRQHDLAELIGHSLTSVGHAETGRLWHSADWWELVDKALNAEGELIRLHCAYRAAQVASGPGDPACAPDVPALAGAEPAVRSGHEEGTAPAADSEAGGQGTLETSAVDLLTADEREAIRQAGQLYVLIAERIVGRGLTRYDDLAEIRAAIHVIQRAVESQAAARAYPAEFRLLGRQISQPSSETGQQQ